jgi:pyruvate formate lyase activating enzyme
VWLRYVMIPDVTDRPQDAAAIAAFVKARPNIQMIDLLPLHKLGANKWRELGLKYPLENHRLPSRAETEAFADQLRGLGANVIC